MELHHNLIGILS